MKRKTGKILSVCLLACCAGAVGLLRGQGVNAEATQDGGEIDHICFGDMDFDLRDSIIPKSIWGGETDELKLKGCTHAIYAYETVLPGKRYVVASTVDGHHSVVAYLNDSPASETMATAVKRLQQKGYGRVKSRAASIGVDNYELFLDGRFRLQVVSVPAAGQHSLLIVIRMPGGGIPEVQP